MPKTISDLENAINAGNLQKVEEVLAVRERDGIDINGMRGHGTALHTVIFSAGNADNRVVELTRDLVQVLLDLRTPDGRVAIDLNWAHRNAGTALIAAIDVGNLGFVEQILDARHNDGNLAINLRHGYRHGDFLSPLTRALFLNHSQIVQYLVDARNADGSHVLSIDNLRHALEGAHGNGARGIADNESTRWLIHYLAEHPDRPADFPDFQVGYHQNQPAANGNFAEDRQNTHSTEVTISVENSVNRLKARYGVPQNIANILSEIKRYNPALSFAERRSIKECLERIEKNSQVRTGIDLTLSQVLAFLWQASEDKEAIVEGQTKPLGNKDIQDRKNNLFKALHEAQNTYGTDNPACFVGTLNKMVEGLDRMHPDITIITGKDAIFNLAVQRCPDLIGENLLKKPLAQQKAILKYWYSLDDNEQAESFLEELKGVINDFFEKEYHTLLTTKERENIVDAIPDCSVPILHYGLHDTIEEIKKIKCLAESPSILQRAVSALKASVQRAFDEHDRTLDEEHECLRQELTRYRKLEKLVEEIIQIISQSTDDNLRQRAFSALEARVRRVFNKNDSRLDEKYRYLRQELALYWKEEKSIREINRMRKKSNNINNALKRHRSYDDTKRQAFISKWDNKTPSSLGIDILASVPHLQEHHGFLKNNYEKLMMIDTVFLYASKMRKKNRESLTANATVSKDINDFYSLVKDERAKCFRKEDLTEKAVNEFIEKVSQRIVKLEPVLEEEREYKMILKNIALVLAGCVVGYLAAGLIKKAITGDFLFFNEKTATQNLLKEIKTESKPVFSAA